VPAGDERRQHPRYDVNLLAEVRDTEGVTRRGRVRDLCLGGALLAGFDEAWMAGLRAGVALELRFDLSSSIGIATVPVRARVARVIDRGVGVQFEASEGPALDSLRRFIDRVLARARASAGNGKGGEHLSRAERGRAQVILSRLSAERGDELLKAWIDAADDALWRGIDRATDGVQKQSLTDDSVRFGHLRAAGVIGPLRARLQEDAPAQESAGADASNGLELVDSERFEVWLEASGLVSRLEDELGEALAALEAQLRNVLGAEVRIPLLPKRLVDAFDGWAEAQGLSPIGRRLALRSGRQALPRLLGGYYRDLGRALDEAGFPKVKLRPPRAQPAPVSVSAREPAAGSTDGATADAAADGPSPKRLTPSRVSELLAGLPPDAFAQLQGEAQGSLKEQAMRLLADLEPGVDADSLPPSVQERIDVADRLVGHLSAGHAVTPQSAKWAQQLGLRIVTSAVADPEFFRPPGHPLLQLLERLGNLAVFLPTGPEAVEDKLVVELDRLVQKAVSRDVRDRDGFRPLIDVVGNLERRRGERFRRDATRAICQLEGRDRRRAAHGYVREGLARRFVGQPMHRVVAEIIDAAWSTLLQLRYLREGESGVSLARGWQVLEGLVASCGGQAADVAEDIDTLVPELDAGLAYLGFDPSLAQDLIEQVQDAAARGRAGLLGEDECPPYELAAEPKTSAQAALDAMAPESVTEIGARVDALAPGGVMRLRDASGERLLRLIWSSPDRAELAFLDGRSGELRAFSREALVMGLSSGDLDLHAATGARAGERALDVTLREMQEQMHYHETRDRVTGLYNQHQLTRRLAEALALPGRHPHLLGFLEIDHFEAINSTGGYSAGEGLLKAVGGLMQARLGAAAMPAFLGGRRFAFILPPGDMASSLQSCEQLCAEIYGMHFEWEGRTYPLTGSIGAVPASPGAGDPDSLLSAAAVAINTAQENGGNRVQVFSEDDEEISRSRDRLRWLTIVEEALRAERIRLRVQMIAPVDPESGRQAHHEVLMRVFDAQGAELDLGRFIATAEAFNLMGKVDRVVIRKAISWAGENPDLLERLGSIAINLSGVSLSDPVLPAFIGEQLEQAGVPPSSVSFEVTETAAVANLRRATEIIHKIRDVGCRVALDDFGAGMSSYTYLKSLPVDHVKIDGFFIRDLLTNPHDLAIVKSMNEIAHLMGIQTIAEFAEHPAVVDRLAEIGVDFVQGYAVRRPVFLDEIRPDY